MKFYKQSYLLKATNNDEAGMLNTLINIGAAYQSNGQFDSSAPYRPPSEVAYTTAAIGAGQRYDPGAHG